jgi:predicted transglutaminase-like cysteine proteinase
MNRALRMAAITLIMVAMPAAAAAPAPVGQQAPKEEIIASPADPISEAKFPNEKRYFVDALNGINVYVNHKMHYTPDNVQYGEDELWVMAPASFKGDCEDYALTKYYILSKADYPMISRAKIRSVLVRDPKTRKILDGHAILEILMPNGSIGFLDNNFDHLMTRAELQAMGYQFFDWN